MNLLRFLPLLLLLCGCAREVSPVSALALDCKNGEYCLTAEVVRQDLPDDTAAPAYLVRHRNRCDGRTAQPAQYPAGRPVFEPCTGAAFKRGCGFREHSSAGGLSLPRKRCAAQPAAAVVRDGSAAELLENDNEVYALSELLDRSAQDGVLPDMPLYRVTDVLHADGTAILPALRVDAFGQTAPAGTAVFKNERLNCFLDGEIGGGAYA